LLAGESGSGIIYGHKNTQMKIQELFSNDRSRWTKEVCARDINGAEVNFYDDSAVCWCLLGASAKCYGIDFEYDIYNKITAKVGCDVSDWNDAPGRTFEEVKDLVEELDI